MDQMVPWTQWSFSCGRSVDGRIELHVLIWSAFDFGLIGYKDCLKSNLFFPV